MAYSYVPVDRDQPFLLPPDLREWLPAGHLVWFVIEVVARVDTSVLHARHGNDGVGRRAYDPDMLLALLIYAYCTGQRSSRQIERLCEVDIAYRVICANHAPDHTTIARFRHDHASQAVRLFTDVLVLCARFGLAKVGVVAVDGTTMAADAARRANRTRAQIEQEVRAMVAEAQATDEHEDGLFGDARGDELPEELADPRRRGPRLDAALKEIEAQERAVREAADKARQARQAAQTRAAARAETALVKARQRAADRYAACLARAARRRGPVGRPPVPAERSAQVRQAQAHLVAAQQRATAPPSEPAEANDKTEYRANTTDVDSRLMKTRGGWQQGYNAQAAVNEQGVVLAARVVQDRFDVCQCQPMMAATQANLDTAGVTEPIGTMLFDAGYCSENNLKADGPDRLIATGKIHKLRARGPAHGDPPPDASPLQAMQHRLRTDEGAALYAKRQHTVEPIFGHIKTGRGFRGFARRGLAAVDAEWKLIAATTNILKLHRTGVILT